VSDREPGGRPSQPTPTRTAEPSAASAVAPSSWRASIRSVVLVAALVVGGVLGAAVLTSALPADAQRFVFHTPLAIAVLVAVTAWVLWRVSARRPPPVD